MYVKSNLELKINLIVKYFCSTASSPNDMLFGHQRTFDLYKFGFQVFLREFCQVCMEDVAIPSAGTVKVKDDAFTLLASLEEILGDITRVLRASRSQFGVGSMAKLSVPLFMLVLLFHLLDAFLS